MAKAGNKTGKSETTSTRNNIPIVTSETDKLKSSMSNVSKSGHSGKIVSLTHEQIAERAKAIWREKGCPSGQDQTNWAEAEAQLKRELAKK